MKTLFIFASLFVVCIQAGYAIQDSDSLNTGETYTVSVKRIAIEDSNPFRVVMFITDPNGNQNNYTLGKPSGMWSIGTDKQNQTIGATSYHAGLVNEWQVCTKGDYIIAFHRSFDAEVEQLEIPFIEVARVSLPEDRQIEYQANEVGMQDVLPMEPLVQIIVGSKTEKAEAIQSAKRIEAQGYLSEVYSRENGYFAVTIGYHPKSTVNDVLKTAKGMGLVPTDAYLDTGEKNVEKVYPDNGTKDLPPESE